MPFRAPKGRQCICTACLSVFLCPLHFGDIADVSEININLLFGLLLVPFGAFVYYDFGYIGMQDFGCKLWYAGVFPREAYEFIHITRHFL